MINAERLLDRTALLIASLLGSGYSPVIPGTVGTAVALPFVILAGLYLNLWGYSLVTVATILLAIWSAGRAARFVGAHDPGLIVIDEAAGLFVTLAGLPIAPWSIVGGFVMFRIMDIIKPPPAARMERLPGGSGIVLDDVIAGVYANLVLRALAFGYHRMVP